MFWSDLGPEVGYEAVGIIDSLLPTVGIFAKDGVSNDESTTVPQSVSQTQDSIDNNISDNDKSGDDYGRGVIFYLREDKVVGIVLWNIFNRMSIARQVILFFLLFKKNCKC